MTDSKGIWENRGNQETKGQIEKNNRQKEITE